MELIKSKSSFVNFFIIFVILIVIYYLNTKKEQFMENYRENYTENYIENTITNIKQFDSINMKNNKLSDKIDPKKIYLYTIDSNNVILNTIGHFTNNNDEINYSKNMYTINDDKKGNVTYNVTFDNKIPFDKEPIFKLNLSFIPRGFALSDDKKRLTIDNTLNYYFSSYPIKTG